MLTRDLICDKIPKINSEGRDNMDYTKKLTSLRQSVRRSAFLDTSVCSFPISIAIFFSDGFSAAVFLKKYAFNY